MENRPAYTCRTFIRIYNIFQIVFNATAVYQIIDNGWYRDHFLYCTEFDQSPTPQNMQFCRIIWWTTCLKICDYIETSIFVLRKKKEQISFLHIYHHVSTVCIAWISMKYFNSGMIMTYPVINCLIHVIMYTYYLLSSLGPNIRKLIHPAKRIITTVQMAQFVFMIIHAARAHYPGCPGMEVLGSIMIPNLAINFVLFYQFYRRTYVDRRNKHND